MKVSVIKSIFGFLYILGTANCFEPPSLQIAGNRALSECISGDLLSTSDLDITTSELIRREGYPVEEHVVLTDDGYYLTLHRIPRGPYASPVLLQHGFLGSSHDWVVSGKENALAFILADRGYDVWLGNSRGNIYSQCHTKYDRSQVEFWNFSFHEMGVYDLPAMIRYITDLTYKKIFYIGHSMGTTESYVMAIERPDITSRVKAIFSLAPVIHLTHGRSAFFSILEFLFENHLFNQIFGEKDFPPVSLFAKRIIDKVCFSSPKLTKLCTSLSFAVQGYGTPDEDHYALAPKLLSHFPAGTSTKLVTHWYQIRINDRFQYYDYGPEGNLKRYNSTTPPEYDVSKIKLPVALFWTENDQFAHPIDVWRLSNRLENTILNHRVESPSFNHQDFTVAPDAFRYVYSKILYIMQNIVDNRSRTIKVVKAC